VHRITRKKGRKASERRKKEKDKHVAGMEEMSNGYKL
jgi:hypothetical protein